MRKIANVVALGIVLVVGANAQSKGKDGKGKDFTVSMPEPNGVSELVVAGAGAGLLALFLRRKSVSRAS